MTTKPAALRWGIVGTGEIAQRFAADLARVDGNHCHAVLSRSSATAAEFARQHGAAGHFSDMAGFLESGCDIVYVASPTALHHEHAIAAISAGKHVLVEKPLAASAAQAREIAKAARDLKSFAMEAMWMRFLPAFRLALDLAGARENGPVRHLRASLAFPRPYEPGSRFFDPALGGGAGLDLGVYAVSAALAFLGVPSRIGGSWSAAPTGVDLSGVVQLGWKDADAELSFGFDREDDNAFVIAGEERTIVIQRHFLRAETVSVMPGTKLRPAGSGRSIADRLIAKLPVPGKKQYHLPLKGNGLVHEIEAVADAIAHDLAEHPWMPLADSIAALDILEAVKAGAPVNQSG